MKSTKRYPLMIAVTFLALGTGFWATPRSTHAVTSLTLSDANRQKLIQTITSRHTKGSRQTTVSSIDSVTPPIAAPIPLGDPSLFHRFLDQPIPEPIKVSPKKTPVVIPVTTLPKGTVPANAIYNQRSAQGWNCYGGYLQEGSVCVDQSRQPL